MVDGISTDKFSTLAALFHASSSILRSPARSISDFSSAEGLTSSAVTGDGSLIFFMYQKLDSSPLKLRQQASAAVRTAINTMPAWSLL
jgi:hypothetical protein